LSLLASQGESELPEVASQRSDERTHILITFGLAAQSGSSLLASPRLVLVLVWDVYLHARVTGKGIGLLPAMTMTDRKHSVPSFK